jgi:hypothetical protein
VTGRTGLPRSAFPFQIRFADVGGMRIHYVDEGSGPTLLLVSAGQWSFMFRDVIDDDPEAYSGAICMWWAQKVAPQGNSANA